MRTTETITLPVNVPAPDGLYPFVLFHSGDQVSYSTTRTGLCEAIISGYAEVGARPTPSDADLLDLRYDVVVELLATIQTSMLVDAAEAAKYSLAEEDDDDVLTAFTQDRNQPFLGVRPDGSEEPDMRWDLEVPLALTPVHYAPFTELPAPTGRIVWLDPSTETSFIDSLAAAGLVKYLYSPAADDALGEREMVGEVLS
jgi:hypothetical protein